MVQTTKFTLTLLLVLAVYSPAKASSSVDEVIATCSKDWDGFDKALAKFYTIAKRDIKNMSTQELTKKLNAEDPQLVLVSLFWPTDLSEKYLSWPSFKDCSEKNFAVRKVLSNSAATPKERAAEIELLESCIHVTYYKDHLAKPLDRLLACYKDRAKR